MQGTILNTLGAIRMAEKINSDDKSIVVILTVEECNVFKNLCMEFLGNYKYKISRNRALVLNKILDKIEEVRK